MPIPSLIFGVILSTIYGVAFHLIRGGSLGRLLLYIVLSWSGFWIGQIVADRLDWNFASIGTLHVGIATICSVIFLLLGYWLSLLDLNKAKK